MKAKEAAERLLTQKDIKRLESAGICFIWQTEKDFLLWAANMKDQEKKTYKRLDKIQAERG